MNLAMHCVVAAGSETFPLAPLDYAAFAGYLVALFAVGWWSGRGERASADDYFLAGKKLPWYVVGGSFIASNISSEHFIGMIGSAAVFGVSLSLLEWANAVTFSLMVWFFIPFLLASKVFTIPEYLARRFSPTLRSIFAVVTILSNVVAFLAAVLYGGALALGSLFGWDLWPSVVFLGLVSGVWAIYGGLSSVAWTDLLTLVIMLCGGVAVTLFGLQALGGDDGSVVDGFAEMIRRNQAVEGPWAEAVDKVSHELAGQDTYNRLSVFQPATHPIVPAISLLTMILSVSVWYNVLNQFMIQRVLGAKNAYHARMGIVFAGGLKLLMPFITVAPGLVLFALHPELLMIEPWSAVKPAADQGYVQLLQELIPAGLRGLFLVALFGAIQSTINSVLNSTATVFTLDIYKALFAPRASSERLVVVGVASSVGFLAGSILLGGLVGDLGGGLFEYIQSLYAFFAPPFAAVFLLGLVWKRMNAAGALAAVIVGFAIGLLMKIYVGGWDHPAWLDPYANQASINWLCCIALGIGVSLATPPPKSEQITSDLTIRWSNLKLGQPTAMPWYASVWFWWLVMLAGAIALSAAFSSLLFPTSP